MILELDHADVLRHFPTKGAQPRLDGRRVVDQQGVRTMAGEPGGKLRGSRRRARADGQAVAGGKFQLLAKIGPQPAVADLRAVVGLGEGKPGPPVTTLAALVHGLGGGVVVIFGHAVQPGRVQGEAQSDARVAFPQQLNRLQARRQAAEAHAGDPARGKDVAKALGRHARLGQPEMLEPVAQVLRARLSPREKIRARMMDGPPAEAGGIAGDKCDGHVLHRPPAPARLHQGGNERVRPIAELFAESDDAPARGLGNPRVVAQREGHG